MVNGDVIVLPANILRKYINDILHKAFFKMSRHYTGRYAYFETAYNTILNKYKGDITKLNDNSFVDFMNDFYNHTSRSNNKFYYYIYRELGSIGVDITLKDDIEDVAIFVIFKDAIIDSINELASMEQMVIPGPLNPSDLEWKYIYQNGYIYAICLGDYRINNYSKVVKDYEDLKTKYDKLFEEHQQLKSEYENEKFFNLHSAPEYYIEDL